MGSLRHHRVCESCHGTGSLPSQPWCRDCDGDGQRDRDPTPADIVAHVAALPEAVAVALLRDLLRARPDAAVEAVDSARVARAWTADDPFDAVEPEYEYPSHRASLANAEPDHLTGTWSPDEVPTAWATSEGADVYDTEAEARAAADAALVADGWVLAGVPRG